jgi:hypothetical protein
MESTVGWARLKLRFIRPASREVGPTQTAEPVPTQTAMISWSARRHQVLRRRSEAISSVFHSGPGVLEAGSFRNSSSAASTGPRSWTKREGM